ncbi:hypothetical protein GCM10010277_68640 [Streptomyces longisporoflavus]|uniref:hypothetical protein n=1 Tax=Streptomyces longisporoflavus TaxID=28044 RepID=UPI00167E3E3A|nr:hypothetical protein [Streptomyces longisporoflavus]GGV62924.1 hypothetical protein GCM10010277_68640 [Streptomyces longisporoflavus]
MNTTKHGVVPYITAREGEEADSFLALRASFDEAGRSRLAYWDEIPADRDVRGVLWARVSQAIGADRLPAGVPKWRLVHPARQRECMLTLRCQVCVDDARTPEGILFLESKRDGIPAASTTIRTAQPPLCRRHARVAAQRCPYLAAHGHIALLAQSAPLYGVIGTPHAYTVNGVKVLAADDVPLRYGDPALRWFLASQLVRTLRSFRVVDLDDIAPAAGPGSS